MNVELYTRIVENSNMCSIDQLTFLKQSFAQEINSNRQLERINNIKMLLETLRKRDSLDDASLQQIASALKLRNLHNNNEGATTANNNYSGVLPQVSKDTKTRVYNLISTTIGRKWIELGRALHMKEGDIDNLEQQYRVISDRVQEMLRFYEQSCDERKWKSGLLQALSESRRNDLKKQVEEIFDTS